MKNNYPLTSTDECNVSISFDPTPAISGYMYKGKGCMPSIATIKPQTSVLFTVPAGCKAVKYVLFIEYIYLKLRNYF